MQISAVFKEVHPTSTVARPSKPNNGNTLPVLRAKINDTGPLHNLLRRFARGATHDQLVLLLLMQRSGKTSSINVVVRTNAKTQPPRDPVVCDSAPGTESTHTTTQAYNHRTQAGGRFPG